MPPEPGIIRDDGFVIADLRNMDASRKSVSRDGGIVIAGSGDMDASLTGVIRDDTVFMMDRF
jgi:hypothetical protein